MISQFWAIIDQLDTHVMKYPILGNSFYLNIRQIFPNITSEFGLGICSPVVAYFFTLPLHVGLYRVNC